MNRFATILSASALSAIAFGAEGLSAIPAFAGSPASKIETTIQTMSGSDFNVVRIDSLQSSDPALEKFGTVEPTSQEARLIQASVIANSGLSKKLEAEKVELTNIVGAEQAADGGITFYVR